MALNKNAEKWVKALRSGKYEQAQSYLATDDGAYCCLGVACELAIKDGVRLKKRLTDDGYFTYGKQMEILPVSVRRWLGLATGEGRFESGSSQSGTLLTELNDEGSTFNQIADVIARQPKGLFKEVPTVKRSGKPATEKTTKHFGEASR